MALEHLSSCSMVEWNTCRMWAPVIPSFSMHYHVTSRLIAVLMAGRTTLQDYSASLCWRKDIARFIEALGLQRPLVVGYSNGGQTALHMAMLYPGLVQGYMVGGVYNSMTDEWQQMRQGVFGFEGSGIVDTERVIQQHPEVVRSLQEKHDAFH